MHSLHRLSIYSANFRQTTLMNREGPIIIIDDDLDDQFLIKEAFESLAYPNEIIFFIDGQKAFDFLNTSDLTPFIILSDINMPRIDGFELRDKINTDENLRGKCIPYLFFSTAVNQRAVVKAYNLSIQGFFLKNPSFDELQRSIMVIMEYWKMSISPNNFMHPKTSF